MNKTLILIYAAGVLGIVGCSRPQPDQSAGPTPEPTNFSSQWPVRQTQTTPRPAPIPAHPNDKETREALFRAVGVLARMYGEIKTLEITSLRWGPAFQATASNGGPMDALIPLERPNAGVTVYPAEVEFKFTVYSAPNKYTTKSRDGGRFDFFRNAMGDLSAVPIGKTR